MTRIKIKCRGDVDRNSKIKLLEILCSKCIHVVKVFNTNDGFAVLTLNEEHAEKIFNAGTKQQLENNGFSASMPPDLKVKKSVIVTRLDDHIYHRNEDEILDELLSHNTWIGDEIHSIFKFPNSSTLKITFTQTTYAKLCTERGLKAFGLVIPYSDIKQETFIPIKTCMRCYSLEQHNTKDCPKGKDYKICSECSQEGHLWFQCNESQKMCINCSGSHSTMAMKCTTRKTLIKDKRKEENERNKMTYAQLTQTRIPQQQTHTQPPQPQPAYNITREETLKINICVAHAHYQNIAKPGCYAEELNKILKANNLPTIVIPDTPDSQNMYTNATEQEIQNTTNAPQVKPRKERLVRRESVGNLRDEGAVANTDTETEERDETIKARDIGLKFYTNEERSWPKNKFTRNDLKEGILSNKYKFTYEDSTWTEEQIFDGIFERQIILQDCWMTVENDVFRKIRSGCSKERSPPEHKEHRIRKTH